MSKFHRNSEDFYFDFPYDPKEYQAVIRASICTGEKVACFQSRKTKELHEIAALQTEEDVQDFMKTYGLKEEDIKTIY